MRGEFLEEKIMPVEVAATAPAAVQISHGRKRALWLAGVGLTFVVAALGFGLAQLPGFSLVGPLACSILLAVAYRQIAGYPERLRAGIHFSARRLLRLAIVLFGLKLNIDIIVHQGLGLLLRDALTITLAISLTVIFARLLKAEKMLSLLLGIGTGVCGAAAIAAVSPILHADEEDTAIGAGIIALLGTIFAIGYTLLRTIVPLTATQYGIWSGISLHEIAHVALAAAPAGQNALALALLAKLGRVFLLVPLSFLLIAWMKRRGTTTASAKVEFPWFLVGFILMSVFGSYILGKAIILPPAAMNDIANVTTFILTMAMVGLGLNVSIGDLRSRAMRPLAAVVLASLVLSLVTYLTIV